MRTRGKSRGDPVQTAWEETCRAERPDGQVDGPGDEEPARGAGLPAAPPPLLGSPLGPPDRAAVSSSVRDAAGPPLCLSV